MPGNPRIDNHPLITGSSLPMIRSKYKNIVTDFYVDKDDVRVFVHRASDERVRVYHPTGSVQYMGLKDFQELGFVKDSEKNFAEIHIRMNDDTVAVVYNYHHGNLIYEQFISDFLARVPYPLAGMFSVTFEMYVSGWGVVQSDEVQMGASGEHKRLKRPMILVGEGLTQLSSK